MKQTPMRQVVRAKIALTDEMAERLSRAGIHLKAASAAAGPQDSFVAEVDAASEVQALQALRRALEPWGRSRSSRSGAVAGCSSRPVARHTVAEVTLAAEKRRTSVSDSGARTGACGMVGRSCTSTSGWKPASQASTSSRLSARFTAS